MSRILITYALLLSVLFPVLAQDDISQFSYWQYYSDIENSLYKHFYSVAHDELEIRKSGGRKFNDQSGLAGKTIHGQKEIF